MHPADGDYDWTREPWFLSQKSEEDVWGARYEREELERAFVVLSERYPPDCPEIARGTRAAIDRAAALNRRPWSPPIRGSGSEIRQRVPAN